MLPHSFLLDIWRLFFGSPNARPPPKLGLNNLKQKTEEPMSKGSTDNVTAVNWPNDLGFDTVREECIPIKLPVTGSIPLYAAGTIYRNGPGAREVFNKQGQLAYSVSHWFDGFAQLHKFELVPGTDGVNSVVYSSRLNVDSLMEELATTGSYSGYTFAQKRDPCMSVFRKIMCLFVPAPTPTATNTSVSVTVSTNQVGFPSAQLGADESFGHKTPGSNHIICRTEDGTMKALDARTLEPVGIASQKQLHPLLCGPLSASHAKSDPLTGDMFNYNLDMGKDAVYRVFKISAKTGETEILATMSAPDLAPAYMHSFFMSENHVILCVWSAHLMNRGLRVLWEKNILDAIAPFDEAKRARWFVVDRKHGKGVVAQFDSPAAFCFHTINAYEVPRPDGSFEIMCDLIEYKTLDVLHAFYYDHLRSSSPNARPWPRYGHRFARYCLPVSSLKGMPSLTSKQREQVCTLPQSRPAHLVSSMTDAVGDLPNINPKNVCKSYRFFWNGTVGTKGSTFFDGLAKVDTVTGESVRWDNAPGHTPGEAIFVPNPDGVDEDDGVLLTIVLDGFKGTSYLLCLDAKTMTELGRADCLGPLPFMFHGQHVKDGVRSIDV